MANTECSVIIHVLNVFVLIDVILEEHKKSTNIFTVNHILNARLYFYNITSSDLSPQYFEVPHP